VSAPTTRLAARGVDFAYPGGPAILHDVNVDVAAGEVVGLVGESGSGKSTLARLLAGLHEPTAGTIERADADAGVQMIFQDPYAALNPRMRAVDAVEEVFRVRAHTRGEQARAAARDLLEQVGLGEDAARRRPGRLSGGQCQRASIARALAAQPAVLIADEPTSSLDVSVQAQILNLLRDLQRERQLSIVLVSHDLSVIRYMADRTFVMHRGEIVESGATEALHDAPQHEYTRTLIASAPGERRVGWPP
jgi:ABC-type glutathione transport system ATPase component